MFEHLLAEHDILLDKPATVPCQKLEAHENWLGFVLRQAKAVDGGAMDCGEVGVVGFIPGIGGLTELLGGVGVKDADLESRRWRRHAGSGRGSVPSAR